MRTLYEDKIQNSQHHEDGKDAFDSCSGHGDSRTGVVARSLRLRNEWSAKANDGAEVAHTGVNPGADDGANLSCHVRCSNRGSALVKGSLEESVVSLGRRSLVVRFSRYYIPPDKATYKECTSESRAHAGTHRIVNQPARENRRRRVAGEGLQKQSAIAR